MSSVLNVISVIAAFYTEPGVTDKYCKAMSNQEKKD